LSIRRVRKMSLAVLSTAREFSKKIILITPQQRGE